MGEMAELVIEGVVCEGCGVFLGEPVGFPQRCAACERPSEEDEDTEDEDTPFG